MVKISICLHTLCLVEWVWDEELDSHWEIKYIARIYCIFHGTLVPWNTTLVFTEFCAYCQFLVFKWWLYRGKALGAVCLVRLYYMLHMFCVSTGSQPWLLQSAAESQTAAHSLHQQQDWEEHWKDRSKKTCGLRYSHMRKQKKKQEINSLFPCPGRHPQECRAPAQVIMTKANVSTSLLLPCPSPSIYG